MPACGSRVVKGYAATSGVARVSRVEQPALAGVGGADDDDLPGPLLGNLVAGRPTLLGMLLGVLDFLPQLAHLRLEIGLHFLAGLVLGHKLNIFFSASLSSG